MIISGGRSYRTFLCIFVILFASVVKAGNEKVWYEAQDLHYGEVLFDYYQQDYYTAIVRLLAAKKKQALKIHKEDAELFLGGLALSYGLHEIAEDVFNSMTNSMLPQDIRNRAWYSLAEMRYQEGLIDSASQALKNMVGKTPKQIVDNYQMLTANLMLAGRQYKEAGNIIEHMRNDINRSYGRYNLAISKINAGHKIEKDSLLVELGQMSVSDDEMKALKDRSNLSLGFYYLQNKNPEKGVRRLQRIRLNGPYSDEALLGLGWALTEQNQLENALATWQLLKERDLNAPAVQEAWIASSFVLEKMKAYAPALQENKDAIVAFDSELERLDSAIDSVNKGHLIRALLQQSPNDIDREIWEMELMPNTAIGEYLPYLMASQHVRKAINNLHDLQKMKGRLVQWQNEMPAYHNILDLRRQTYEKRLPKLNEHAQSIMHETFQSQMKQLAHEVKRIDREEDEVALNTKAERQLLNKLDKVEEQINDLKGSIEVYDSWEKYKFLRGIIEWEINTDFKVRLWKAKKQLNELDKILTETAARQSGLGQVKIRAPKGFEGYGDQINEMQVRIEALQIDLRKSLIKQQHYVQRLVITELLNHQKRISDYRDQARFSIARINDQTYYRRSKQQ
jgi:hypothetical protein